MNISVLSVWLQRLERNLTCLFIENCLWNSPASTRLQDARIHSHQLDSAAFPWATCTSRQPPELRVSAGWKSKPAGLQRWSAGSTVYFPFPFSPAAVLLQALSAGIGRHHRWRSGVRKRCFLYREHFCIFIGNGRRTTMPRERPSATRFRDGRLWLQHAGPRGIRETSSKSTSPISNSISAFSSGSAAGFLERKSKTPMGAGESYLARICPG
ncbi:Hypothetical_protein [Hexamita inflata]|nr:Hypothetical protein HINF_LOCUS3485 [Hexamita inflata]CAI9915841.1 Hypothetical protein HINF_LOCUS3486 [Hexamita inflata]CAI9925184.1 Hypothetical protein HINF_LOCUS12829 [Hexamita inflata]CAI9925185.1 Hypothetical protein HINF_LOCUS12830 [Hexamita inflata]